ncbi:hypothetical protein ACFC1R_32555 [Kitasatospora sp. NPDC056138]|uniref:hypothetical protein n=1 Tax=Kitasatospora sp. NPDC056138 TaxID=3345724 RepID=UPI0035E3649C
MGDLNVQAKGADVSDVTTGEGDGLEVPAGRHPMFAVTDAPAGEQPLVLAVLLWFGPGLPTRVEYCGIGVRTHCGVVCLDGGDGDGGEIDELMKLAHQEIRRRERGRGPGLEQFEEACGSYWPQALEPATSAPHHPFGSGWQLSDHDGRSGATVAAFLDWGEGGGLYDCLDAENQEVGRLIVFETL